MYLHTPAVEVDSWYRVDTASGSDTATTVYYHDGSDPIGTSWGTSGSTVKNSTRDGTARFWSATATLYLKQLTFYGVPSGTVVASTGVLSQPLPTQLDIPTILSGLSGTYIQRAKARLVSRSALIPAPPVVNRVGFHSGLRADAGCSSRIKHTMARDAGNLQLVYTNYSAQYGTEPDGAITVSASIEYPSGTYLAVHFGGEDANRKVTIPKGGVAVSLPVGIDIPAGAVLYSNTTVVPVGTQYPIGGAAGIYGAPTIDAVTVGSATDYTMTAQVSPSGTAQFCYAPVAICGIPSSGSLLDVPVIGIFGDSISQGVGDSARMSTGLDQGFIQRAVSGVSPGLGYMTFGVNGYQAQNYTGSVANRRHHLEIASSFTDVVLALGTNDFINSRTLAQVKADLTSIWGYFAARGCKVWQTTLVPRTTSTDSWATLANQTALNSNFGPEGSGGSNLTQLNTWIKTLPSAALTGYIDATPVVGSYNSGTDTWAWKAGYTTDGIHPSSTGHAALAAVVPTASFG